MVYKPRQTDVIIDSIQTKLEGQIEKLTNFSSTSFNSVWTESFSDRFRDTEIALSAVQLNGWIGYAGGPVTEDDLERLDIDENVDPEDVNEYLDDGDLDNLVEILGIDRSPGKKATGTVEFTTVSSATTIPEGTSVGTEPDATGDFFEFTTDSEVSTGSGDTTVTANITAVDEGSGYNVGSGTITYMPSPPTGVQSVTNNSATEGGVDEETNDELRARAKNAIFNQSGGGTAEGVKGAVLSSDDEIQSVAVKEYPGGNDSTSSDYEGPGGPGGASSTSPFADVIVEGGDSTNIQDEIDDARPVAIQHNLVRPTFISVGIDADVTGSDIDTADVNSALQNYLNDLDLGEDVVRDKIIQTLMNADPDIDGIDTLTVHIEEEVLTYDSDNSGGDAPNHPLYKLRKGDSMTSDGITEVTGTLSGSSHTFVEDTDYDEGTVDGASPDAIDWGLGGDNPDEDTDFNVTYTISDDIPIDEYEKSDPGTIDVTVV